MDGIGELFSWFLVSTVVASMVAALYVYPMLETPYF